MNAPTVRICEVGPRDGLQNDAIVLPPSTRAELTNRLAATGVSRVEAASFVHPGKVPAMAGAEEVFAGIERRPGVEYSALVLNQRGLDRALECDVDLINIAFPVTDEFCRRNQNTTSNEAAEATVKMVSAGQERGKRVAVTLAAAFGCPFEGDVDPGRVIELIGMMAEAGADEISLADTIGVGSPKQVHRLLREARTTAPGATLGLHLHNTRNTGYANAYAALEHSINILDASVAGIGGCPFAPNATGNIATEDLVYLLDKEGVETGVDIEAMISMAEWLTEKLGRELPGLLHRAGPFPAK